MLLDVLDDVFLLDLPLEAAQSALDRFVFLNSDLCHVRFTPSVGSASPVWRADSYARLNGRPAIAQDRVNPSLPSTGAGSGALPVRSQPGSRAGCGRGVSTLNVLGHRERRPGSTRWSGRSRPTSPWTASSARPATRASPPGRRRACRWMSRIRRHCWLALAAGQGADLTVVGPELPLARGAADVFAEAGRLLFGTVAGGGPRSNRARRSRRRSWRATAFRRRASRYAPTNGRAARGRPRGPFRGFRSWSRGRRSGRGQGGSPWRPGRDAAEAAVRDAMVARRFGDAGATVVIEECLQGPEVSWFVVSDGRALPDAAGGPGSQARLRWRRGTEHRRDGGVRAESARRWRSRGAHHADDRRAGARWHARRGGPRVPRRALRRPDADAGRSAGDRVQRALRRSGGTGHSADGRERPGAGTARGGARASVRFRMACDVGSARRGGAGLGRISRTVCDRTADQRSR